MTTPALTLGAHGEELACRNLRRRGYTIVSRNWRCPLGEIDIVARHEDTYAIVEVKTRGGTGFGHPFEAITPSKLRRLRLLAGEWALAHNIRIRNIRIDALAVTMVPDAPAIFEHLQDIS